jgi:carbon storage regulator
MLVLTRKAGERIVIADVIKIVVLQAQGNRVRIGIEAPRDLPIYRQERWEEPAPPDPCREGPRHR